MPQPDTIACRQNSNPIIRINIGHSFSTAIYSDLPELIFARLTFVRALRWGVSWDYNFSLASR